MVMNAIDEVLFWDEIEVLKDFVSENQKNITRMIIAALMRIIRLF